MQSPLQSEDTPGKKERGPRLVIEGPFNTAFSLIELCAAMTVLALLVLLTVWATSSVRQSAAMTKSIGNLRQISTGLSAYIADNKGFFPESAATIYVNDKKVTYWFNALSHYIDGTTDFAAAEASVIRPRWQTCPGRAFANPGRYAGRGVSVGYGWNHQFFGNNDGADHLYRYGWKSRLAEVEIPSQTIIIGTNRETENDGAPISADDPANVYLYASSPTSRRFNGAGLYLFVDGSVKRMTPEEVSLGVSKDSKEYRYLFKKKKYSLPYPEDNRPK